MRARGSPETTSSGKMKSIPWDYFSREVRPTGVLLFDSFVSLLCISAIRENR